MSAAPPSPAAGSDDGGLRFRDLGPLEVFRDGAPVPIGGARLTAALSLLLINAGRHVGDAALMEAMWSAQARPRSPSTLESHVWRLRKNLEPDRERGTPSEVLRREAGGYRLVATPGAVDSLRCERLATRARDALAGDAPAEALRCTEEGLALWRGRPYPTVADEVWATSAVARLLEMRDQLRELQVESLLAIGAPERALLELEPAIADSPLRERLHALRMRAQHRLGRTEEALRTYQEARNLLRDELGLEPGRELREAHAVVLAEAHAPEPRQTSAAHQPSDRLLAVAALCGREFDIAVVQSAVTADRPLSSSDELFAALARWTADGVVEPVARSMSRYRFRDGGQVEELASTLDPAARADAHHRLGEAVERQGGPLAQTARHFLLAAPVVGPRRGVDAGARAGDDALARDAFGEAAELYELTLEAQQFDQAPDLSLRADLLLRLGRARMAAGRRDQALEALQSAVGLAERLPPEQRGEVLIGAATAYSSWPSVPDTESVDRGLRSLVEAAQAALAAEDDRTRALLLARLAQALRHSPEVERGQPMSVEAERIARRLDDPATLVSALVARRLLVTDPAADRERLDLTAEAARIVADGHPDLPLLLFLQVNDHVTDGDLAAASMASTRLENAVRDGAAPGPLWLSARTRAALALLAGRLDRAEELMTAALDLGTRAQHPRARVTYETQRLLLHAWRGTSEDPLPWWRSAAETSAWHKAVFAWLAVDVGHPDEARVAVEELTVLDVARLPRNGAWLALCAALADATTALGMDDAAAHLLDVLRPYRGRVVAPFNGVVWAGSVDHWIGTLAAASGGFAEAEQRFVDALALNDRLGAALAAASTRTAYADMLGRRGRPEDRQRAAGLRDQALATSRARGATRLVERLDQPGAPPVEAVAASPLSDRERDVLRLVAGGLTNREIGARLHISPATVQRHTINLYRKIGARGRGEAAAYAVRHGIADAG